MRVERIFILGPLDDVLGIAKPSDRAGVIQMQMGHDHVTHILGLYSDRPALFDTMFLEAHMRLVDIHHISPMRALVDCHFGRVSAIDDHIAHRMFQQVPRHGNFPHLVALIHLDVVLARLQRSGLEHVQLHPRADRHLGPVGGLRAIRQK